MSNIRTLLVDDEKLARERLAELLARQSDVELVGTCRSGKEALRAIRVHRPQLVFLDIQMRDMTGLDVAEQLMALPEMLIVFVTAFDQHAVRAFELHAADYLLKPYGDERFGETMRRVRERMETQTMRAYNQRLIDLLEDYRSSLQGVAGSRSSQAHGAARLGQAYAERIVLKTGSRKIFIQPEEVDWIQAEGVYVRLHSGGKSYLLRDSLNAVEARLDPARFVRIHRSTIVNVARIRDITPHFNGGSVVSLTDGRTLKLSRGYQDRVRVTIGT